MTSIRLTDVVTGITTTVAVKPFDPATFYADIAAAAPKGRSQCRACGDSLVNDGPYARPEPVNGYCDATCAAFGEARLCAVCRCFVFPERAGPFCTDECAREAEGSDAADWDAEDTGPANR